MQTLFAISVLCFLGVLWAALAFARHIKRRTLSPAAPHADFKHHILSITPISAEQFEPMRIAPLPVDAIPVEPPQAQPEPRAFIPSRIAPVAPPPEERVRLHDLNQSVHDIGAKKQWTLPPHSVRTMRLPVQRIGRSRQFDKPTRTLVADRKPPQSASRSGVVHRLDPAYFNKDLGDLTDPYQPQPRLRSNERSRQD